MFTTFYWYSVISDVEEQGGILWWGIRRKFCSCSVHGGPYDEDLKDSVYGGLYDEDREDSVHGVLYDEDPEDSVSDMGNWVT